MRIVVLSCNTGEGHNSTAKAIREVLNARGVESELVDVLACLSPRFSKFVCSWFSRLYKYAPKLWDVSYRAFEKKEMRLDESAMLSELLSFGTSKLRSILDQGHYDAVICVHVFSGMMMTELRKVRYTDLPCYFVSTDYTCYPYVDRCEMDGCFIPAKDLMNEFCLAGIPEDRLIPSGIPVRQLFYSRAEKAAVREALALPEDSLAVLLMCGSMGCGPMRKIARRLTERLPENGVLVAVCGKNEKLFQALSSICDPRMRVLGFTDQIPAYMDAADIMVTKPGGLSATEAANKRLPMVFINAVGGCESRNFDFFLKRGYAVGSGDADEAVELTAGLAADPERRARMAVAMEADFSCNSAKVIADTVMEAGAKYRAEKARTV